MTDTLRTFILDEVNGMIDSLDETATHEDMGRVLLELRDSVRDGSWQPAPTEQDRNAWDAAVQAKRAEQRAKGYTAEHDREHGVEHLLLWAQDYASRGRHLDAAALVEAAREVLLWQRSAKSDHGSAADAISRYCSSITSMLPRSRRNHLRRTSPRTQPANVVPGAKSSVRGDCRDRRLLRTHRSDRPAHDP